MVDDGEDRAHAADADAKQENHAEREDARARQTAGSLANHAGDGFHATSS